MIQNTFKIQTKFGSGYELDIFQVKIWIQSGYNLETNRIFSRLFLDQERVETGLKIDYTFEEGI